MIIYFIKIYLMKVRFIVNKVDFNEINIINLIINLLTKKIHVKYDL